MTTEGRPVVREVLETCLYARSIDQTADFYERVLGLEILSRQEGRHVFFRAGRGVFLLFNPERTKGAGDLPSHGTTGAGHVAFAVPQEAIPRWRSVLDDNQLEIETEVVWPGGGISLYFRDPAGNSVELASPAIWSIPEDRVFTPVPPRD